MDLNQRGADYPFQFAMIAFNHVVPVLNLSVFNVRRAPAFAFEQSKRATIGGRFIRVDESRDLPLLHVVEDFTETGMQLCCYDGRRDKNRQCGPGCRRPGEYAQRPLTFT